MGVYRGTGRISNFTLDLGEPGKLCNPRCACLIKDKLTTCKKYNQVLLYTSIGEVRKCQVCIREEEKNVHVQ